MITSKEIIENLRAAGMDEKEIEEVKNMQQDSIDLTLKQLNELMTIGSIHFSANKTLHYYAHLGFIEYNYKGDLRLITKIEIVFASKD